MKKIINQDALCLSMPGVCSHLLWLEEGKDEEVVNLKEA